MSVLEVRDLTIALQEHGPIGGAFRNPTTKAGVPHVDAKPEHPP